MIVNQDRQSSPRFGATWALVVAAALGGAGCEDRKPAPPPPVKKVAAPAPQISYSATRVYFPATPIAALNGLSPTPMPLKSLLKVDRPMSFGEYRWDDERVGPGRPWALVDLSAQTISVFRAGEEIGRAVTLFGVDGHPTPTGRFTILARAKQHVSNIYDAAMPYTLRLTNEGIAIHASNVRRGVGTHGCVGVPLKFGAKLFDAMRVGDAVYIIGADAKPTRVPPKRASSPSA